MDKKAKFSLEDLILLLKKNEIKNSFWEKFFIPNQDSHYIVSLSGGPDSIFLSYLYYEFKKKN